MPFMCMWSQIYPKVSPRASVLCSAWRLPAQVAPFFSLTGEADGPTGRTDRRDSCQVTPPKSGHAEKNREGDRPQPQSAHAGHLQPVPDRAQALLRQTPPPRHLATSFLPDLTLSRSQELPPGRSCAYFRPIPLQVSAMYPEPHAVRGNEAWSPGLSLRTSLAWGGILSFQERQGVAHEAD